MDTSNNISEIIDNTVGQLEINELMLLYRIHNYLIQITERPPQSIFITNEQAKSLHLMFLQTKQALVKCIYKDSNKMEILLSTQHISPLLDEKQTTESNTVHTNNNNPNNTLH